MFEVLPANVNERKALDAQGPRLVKNGVRCIVGDSGGRDKGRAAVYAMDGVLLLTPDTGTRICSSSRHAGSITSLRDSLNSRRMKSDTCSPIRCPGNS